MKWTGSASFAVEGGDESRAVQGAPAAHLRCGFPLHHEVANRPYWASRLLRLKGIGCLVDGDESANGCGMPADSMTALPLMESAAGA